MAIKGYCGYCGVDYKGQHRDICDPCYSDPDLRRQYEEDCEYEFADQLNEMRLAQEQWTKNAGL